jgi:hypothetical protein
MANTTYFGWETPDDTDLVKDGAAAIRTLGQAIDTSMQDLEGGTTGQILAKNSNADMDFVWVTNDVGDITEVVAGTGLSGGGSSGSVTLTNTVATEFDAKGDLVVGTGADTFDKLSAGTNDHRLVAASGETTGLKYVADTQNTVIDAAGDLLYGTAADTLGRLAIGTANQQLRVNSGATAPEWFTPAGASGGMTLINTGGTTFSGASVTVSSIPSTYKKLEIFIVNARPANDNVAATIRFNGSSTANTYFNAEGSQLEGGANAFNANAVNLNYGADNGTQASLMHITIPDYANSTTWKYATISSIIQDSAAPSSVNTLWAISSRNNTEAISSLEFLWSSGNGTSGTIYVYGVN